LKFTNSSRERLAYLLKYCAAFRPHSQLAVPFLVLPTYHLLSVDAPFDSRTLCCSDVIASTQTADSVITLLYNFTAEKQACLPSKHVSIASPGLSQDYS
jgi:hypothetical protein